MFGRFLWQCLHFSLWPVLIIYWWASSLMFIQWYYGPSFNSEGIGDCKRLTLAGVGKRSSKASRRKEGGDKAMETQNYGKNKAHFPRVKVMG